MKTDNTPWVDSFRPKSLNDVIGNDGIIATLKEIATEGNLPNMILSGPPGVGKTTTVLALARHLLGNSYKEGVLQLNASDERGIDVVRDKIKIFASQKVSLPENRQKIIILDEADSMTESAQQALRVIISDFSLTTRFVFACNDSSQIISAIQSRCILLRYSKLTSEDIRNNLLRVINEKQIEYDEDGLSSLVETTDGDMRYALNNLQSTVIGLGKLTKENLYKIIDIPKPEKLISIIELCQEGKLMETFKVLQELIYEGYSVLDILNVFSRVITNSQTMDPKLIFSILKLLSEFKQKILNGYNKEVNIYHFFCEVCDIFK